MTNKFYPLRVKHIDRSTADCAVISLDVPPEWQTLFRYRQGQHLTFRTTFHGEEVRRSYSLCSSPLDEEWKVAVKKVPMGSFSGFVYDHLAVGDTLDVMPPNGQFFLKKAAEAQAHYVAFAAGSGITPILSIIKTHLRTEAASSFQLFYINRSTSSMMLREELEALKNQYLDRFELFHFLTREERDIPLFNGRLSREKLELLFRIFIDRQMVNAYFICGPADMIFLIRDYLLEIGIAAQDIHFELFGTSRLPSRKSQKSQATAISSRSRIRILEGGKSFSFDHPGQSMSILDAALQKKADLPFACKGGVCCTCKARLVEGKVTMEVNYALEQDQVDAGYILTCQAIPVSAEVVVDYDA